MSDLSVQLGQRIREFRKKCAISQEELGYKASISAAHLGQIERGLKKPTIDTLGKISAALEIPLKDLVDFDTPVANDQASTTLETINFLLSSMQERHQEDLLKIIRIFLHFRENE